MTAATIGPDQQRSLWLATAPHAPATTSLEERVEADFAIIGAGYTGLACALALAEAGRSVIVLEAKEIGHGASGRNGGQVIPGLKHDPDDLVARYGREHGEALVRLAGGAADRVFALIAKHGIECSARQCGWIQPAVGCAARACRAAGRATARVTAGHRSLSRRLARPPRRRIASACLRTRSCTSGAQARCAHSHRHAGDRDGPSQR